MGRHFSLVGETPAAPARAINKVIFNSIHIWRVLLYLFGDHEEGIQIEGGVRATNTGYLGRVLLSPSIINTGVQGVRIKSNKGNNIYVGVSR